MFFYGPLHMDTPVLADQQELIYISFVRTLDVDCQKRCMIGTDVERVRGIWFNYTT